MRPYLRLLFFSSICVSLTFSACRNEPKEVFKPWDKTVKARISGDPESLGYLYATHGTALQIIRQINLPLADFHPATEQLVPLLAKAMPTVREITEGEHKGLVAYDFEIREAATWANGSPVTGNDVLSTVKAIYNPLKRSIYAGYFGLMQDVIVDETNPKKFSILSKKFIMAGPSYSNMAPLPAYLYDPEDVLENYTLNQLRTDESLKDNADLQKLANDWGSPKFLRSPEILQGSGPYQLSDWTTGQEIVLTKRANWWGEGLGKDNRMLQAIPEKVLYKMVPDVNAAISLMKNEEIDIVSMIDWTTFLKEKDNTDFNEMVNFYTPNLYALRMMNFNTNKEKLSDKRVRRAIAHLFNFDEINKTVWYGYSEPIASPVYPSKPAYNKALQPIGFNVEKAKQLLTEAGWKDSNGNGIVDKEINGEQVELDLELAFANGNPDYATIASIFSTDAKEAGVNIIPKSMESSAYMGFLKGSDFDITFSAIRDYPFNMDAANKWHSKGGSNYTSFGTAASDALIKELRGTVDVEKQNELWKELQAIIYEEQPGLFIGIDKDRIIANKRFGELTVNGLSPGYYINEFNGNVKVPVANNN